MTDQYLRSLLLQLVTTNNDTIKFHQSNLTIVFYFSGQFYQQRLFLMFNVDEHLLIFASTSCHYYVKG